MASCLVYMLPCTHGDIVSSMSLCTLLHSCSPQFNLLQSQYDEGLKDYNEGLKEGGALH